MPAQGAVSEEVVCNPNLKKKSKSTREKGKA